MDNKIDIFVGIVSMMITQTMWVGIFLDVATIDKRRVKKYGICACALLAISIGIRIQGSIIILGMTFWFAAFLFEGKVTQKIWTNLLAIAICFAISTIDWMVTDTIIKGYHYALLENQILTEIRIVGETWLVCKLAKQTSLINKARGQYKRISRWQAAGIGMIAFTTIFIIYIGNMIYSRDLRILENSAISISCIYICMLCMVGIIIGINEEISKLYFKWSNECMEEQLNRQLKYYQRLEEFNKETRAIKHDMRNHMIIIRSLAQREEFNQLEQYISKIESTTNRLDNIVHTGNSIVDAILNEKLAVAKEKQIQVNYEVRLTKELNLQDMDLCIVFCNSIDNSIEACEKIENLKERKIEIKAVCDRGCLLYTIRNTSSKLAEIVEGEISTDKKDSINHGFGLRNIKNCVLRNNGTVKIDNKEDSFSLQIDIPMK